MSRDSFRCNICRATVAVKRRGVVRIVSPAVGLVAKGDRLLVQCKCGGKRWIVTS